MGQRNMLCTSQMNDIEIDQQAQGYLCPEPCFLMGGMTNFRQPNIHAMVSTSGNTSNLDMHNFPEPYEGAVFYGMPQFIRVQEHHPAAILDIAVQATPNFYNPYAASSSSPGLIPVPLNHGSTDQLPSSSNYAAFGVPADNHGRNSLSVDGVGGPYKRKHAEGVRGSFQYYNSSASSSSSVAPFNTRHPEGVAIMDAVSFRLPQFRGNGMVMEAGTQQSARNGLGSTAIDPVQGHGHNHLIQGNFMGQPFQPSGTQWVDQQINSNSSGASASAWTQSPPIPYMHGSNVNAGYVENGGMAVHGYHEIASNRSSSSFLHPPPNHSHFNIHYPSPLPVQGARVHNVNIYPQVPGTSYGLPTNTASRNMMNPSQDGLEVDRRHPRPVPTSGLGFHRPHQGDVSGTTLRYRNLPHLRVLPADEVAILELPGYHEAGNAVDHHRDMRMDIEDMTYEDLLALGERIGNVSTGLTEEDIVKQMKTRTHASGPATINLEEAAPSVDEESDSCIICQADYVNKETIGTLGCGHEYHADCLKKWLLVKNVCPICKSEALSTGHKQA